MTAVVIDRAPNTHDELYHFIQWLWGVTIPRTQVCPDHSTPFDALAEAYFAEVPISVWKASRALGGKSRTLAYLTLTEAVTLGARVNLLGGSGEQSRNVHEAMQEGWSSPAGSSIYNNVVLNDTQYYTALNNGARIKALMASQRSVRGPHPERLRMDEIDEMEIDILEAALGQPMPSEDVETNVVLSSTHQYPDKSMTEMIRRSGQNGWPVHEWCFRETSNTEDGWLRPSTIERMKHSIPHQMWEVEFELQEPSFGNRAFITEKIEEMFSLGDEVYKHHDVNAGEKYIFEEPDPQGEYVTGADWAKEQDWTVIATFRVDVSPWELVAYHRFRRKPYPMMVNAFNQRLRDYPGDACHDATGLGNVINDYIDERAKKFIMVGRKRDDMLTEYVNAVEKGMLKAPKIESAYSEHKFCSVDDLYRRGQEFHLPDTVCAFALAWHMDKRRHYHAPPVDLTTDSYWKSLEVRDNDEEYQLEGEVVKKTAGYSLDV